MRTGSFTQWVIRNTRYAPGDDLPCLAQEDTREQGRDHAVLQRAVALGGLARKGEHAPRQGCGEPHNWKEILPAPRPEHAAYQAAEKQGRRKPIELGRV